MLVFVHMHAHWYLWVSVRMPDMSLSCSAVLILQLNQSISDYKETLLTHDLLMLCSTCTGHPEQQTGGLFPEDGHLMNGNE